MHSGRGRGRSKNETGACAHAAARTCPRPGGEDDTQTNRTTQPCASTVPDGWGPFVRAPDGGKLQEETERRGKVGQHDISAVLQHRQRN